MLKFTKNLKAKDIIYRKTRSTPLSVEQRIQLWIDKKAEYLKEHYSQKMRVIKILDKRNSRKIQNV